MVNFFRCIGMVSVFWKTELSPSFFSAVMSTPKQVAMDSLDQITNIIALTMGVAWASGIFFSAATRLYLFLDGFQLYPGCR